MSKSQFQLELEYFMNRAEFAPGSVDERALQFIANWQRLRTQESIKTDDPDRYEDHEKQRALQHDFANFGRRNKMIELESSVLSRFSVEFRTRYLSNKDPLAKKIVHSLMHGTTPEEVLELMVGVVDGMQASIATILSTMPPAARIITKEQADDFKGRAES